MGVKMQHYTTFNTFATIFATTLKLLSTKCKWNIFKINISRVNNDITKKNKTRNVKLLKARMNVIKSYHNQAYETLKLSKLQFHQSCLGIGHRRKWYGYSQNLSEEPQFLLVMEDWTRCHQIGALYPLDHSPPIYFDPWTLETHFGDFWKSASMFWKRCELAGSL